MLGLAAAMLAHYAANLPIGLAQRGWLGSSKAAVQTLLSLWVLGAGAAGVIWLAWLNFSRTSLRVLLYGRADCPECGGEYERAFWAINMGPRRYEPCPHCRKWHWTTAKR